jgi:hypothetical protein
MERQSGAIVSGAGLLLAGGWLIAASLNLIQIPVEQFWPLLLSLAGLTMIVQYSAVSVNQMRGLLAIGTMLFLLGFFLSGFTLHFNQLDWPDLSRLWPIFFLIFAAGLTTLYLAENGADRALLATIYVIEGIGVIALPLTMEIYKRSDVVDMLQLWPLIIIIILLYVFLGQGHSDVSEK